MAKNINCRDTGTSALKLTIASIATGVFALFAAPASAGLNFNSVSIGDLNFDDDREFFEQLVDLDADEIAEIREEMADARAEIADAIAEIADAREEVRSTPGAGAVLRTALGAASAIVEHAVKEAFDEVEAELVVAEGRLEDERSALGEDEYAETKQAIDVIRTEIASLDVAIDELIDAMRG